MCRCGPEECLLRFDELSGETELVKADVANDSADQHVIPKVLKRLRSSPKVLSQSSPKISKKVMF